MKNTFTVALLVIALVFFSGCLGSPAVYDSAQGDLHAHYEYTEGWSIGQGCYEQVKGYVYTAGNVSADAVQLNFNLVNTGTGTIRDSRAIFIGPVGKGETRTYETVLDGECTQEYRVDFLFGE
jgi:PBP1b-binding outer membrane lipoprotein LpoB